MVRLDTRPAYVAMALALFSIMTGCGAVPGVAGTTDAASNATAEPDLRPTSPLVQPARRPDGVSGPIEHPPVTPGVQQKDLRQAPTAAPWKPGEPVREMPDLRRSNSRGDK